MPQIQIPLTSDQCEEAIQFGRKILEKNAQSNKDFGSTKARQYNDNFADIIEGKIAEIGFAEFYKNQTGNKIVLDFNVYPDPLTIDYGQDIDKLIVNSKVHFLKSRIDIKATKMFSKWLLVESHKFWADAYILIKVDIPSDSEINLSSLLNFVKNNDVKVTIAGFAYYFDLVDNETKKPFIGFNQNQRLFRPDNLNKIPNWSPNTIMEYISKNPEDFPPMGPILKSPKNFGLPISKLRNSDLEWSTFFNWIHSSLEEVN